MGCVLLYLPVDLVSDAVPSACHLHAHAYPTLSQPASTPKSAPGKQATPKSANDSVVIIHPISFDYAKAFTICHTMHPHVHRPSWNTPCCASNPLIHTPHYPDMLLEPSPPQSQASTMLTAVVITALSVAQPSSLVFVSHLAAFLDHRRRIGNLYAAKVGASSADLEGLALPTTADFVLSNDGGDDERFNPAMQQQRFGGSGSSPVRSMDELYGVATAARPGFEQMLGDVAGNIDGVVVKLPAGLKGRARAAEKADDSYAGYNPGPAVSWLFDIVRGSLVCATVAAVFAVVQAVAKHPSVKSLVKFKNRFATPTPAGFRDLMLVVSIEVTNLTTGTRVLHTCEVQVHLEPVLTFAKANGSHYHYEYFRTYFQGASDTVAQRLEDLMRIVGSAADAADDGAIAKPGTENDLETGRRFLEKVLQDVLNSEDTQRMDALYDLLSSSLSEHDLAMCVLKQMEAQQVKSLGPDHPDIDTTYNNMAVVLRNQGQLERAMVMYEKALAISVKSLGPDHSEVGGTYNNMAIVLESQGQLERAMVIHEKALAIMVKSLGPDHPDVGDTQYNVANLLKRQGKRPEAAARFRDALRISIATHGENHAEVTDARRQLAALE